MENYKSSALRHFSNALVLQMAKEFDNAGHLLGLAVECAIKNKCNLSRQDFSKGDGHLPNLLIIAKKNLNHRSDSSLISVLNKNVMNAWNINDRYCTTGDTSEEQVRKWVEDAKLIFRNTGIKKNEK